MWPFGEVGAVATYLGGTCLGTNSAILQVIWERDLCQLRKADGM